MRRGKKNVVYVVTRYNKSTPSVHLFEIISDFKAVFYVGLPCTFRIDFQRRYSIHVEDEGLCMWRDENRKRKKKNLRLASLYR